MYCFVYTKFNYLKSIVKLFVSVVLFCFITMLDVNAYSQIDLGLHQQGQEECTTALFLIYFGESHKPVLTKYIVMSTKDVTNLKSLSQDEMKEILGYIPDVMVMEVTIKPTIKLVTLGEYYDRNELPSEKRELPLYIGEQLVDNKETVLIDESNIDKFEVLDSKIVIVEK